MLNIATHRNQGNLSTRRRKKKEIQVHVYLDQKGVSTPDSCTCEWFPSAAASRCFRAQVHRHFLPCWLNPDGSHSSGRAVGFGLGCFYAAFHFILTRVREEGFFFPGKLRGAAVLLAPMWLKNIIGRSLCVAVLVTLPAGEAMATNCPPPRSQGQGWWVCRGSCSLDRFAVPCLSSVRKDPCPSKPIRSFLPGKMGENAACRFILSFSWLRPHPAPSFFVV